MAKGDKIQRLDAVEVEVDGVDGKMEVAPGAVQSVTTEVPHEADASSAPGPYNDLDVNRPPVSTNRPNVPIAHSLVAGAGAPTGPPEYSPEAPTNPKDNPSAYVNDADRKAGLVFEMDATDDGMSVAVSDRPAKAAGRADQS